jgi:hypothetical protein
VRWPDKFSENFINSPEFGLLYYQIYVGGSMKNKTIISEEDIFNYVFFQQQLEDARLDYLRKNSGQFTSQIAFYESFRPILEQNGTAASPDLDKKLAARIPAFHEHFYELTPLRDNPQANGFKLAAASEQVLHKKLETQTFLNDDSSLLLRLVRTDENALLYVFAQQIFKGRNLILTLHPSGREYTVTDCSKAITLDACDTVEKITVDVRTPQA